MNERASKILDSADALKDIVDKEVGRRVAEHLNGTLDLLHKVARAVNDAQNHITAVSVGYSHGSLPKKGAR